MNKKYWYISVDDEVATHHVLQYVMKDYPNYQRKAHFTSPEVALDFLSKESCDLMFLDIEMPDMDGFSLLDKMLNPPLTIMLTGYSIEYSERAHEYYDKGIIDFISKSLEEIRFSKSLDRFERLLATKINMDLKQNSLQDFHSESVCICEFPAYKTIYSGDILYVSVEKNYLRIRTSDGESHVIRSSLLLFINKYFPKNSYIQVDRGTVVMFDYISSFNTYSINMGKDLSGKDILIPIAVRRRKEVEKTLLDYFKKNQRHSY